MEATKQCSKCKEWKDINSFSAEKWHIDYIYPDSKFNYKSIDDEEFKKCWALSNLQPLWAEEK